MKNTKNTKYTVTANHDIVVDDYNDGELESIRSHTQIDTFEAKDPLEAIEKYFEFIGYTYASERSEIDGDTLFYSVHVNGHDVEPSEDEIHAGEKVKKHYMQTIYVSM